MLFDLKNDPDELRDLGRHPDYSAARAEMYEHLHTWSLRMSQRLTMSDEDIESRRVKGGGTGIVIGVYDEDDIPANLTVKYRGKIPPMNR